MSSMSRLLRSGRIPCLAWSLIFLGRAWGSGQETTTYFGQDPPGLEPEMFAPGVISTEANEFSFSFSPGGREVFFTRRHVVHDHTIMTSRLTDSGWMTPEPFEATLALDAFEPCVSADGSRLYFVSMAASPEGTLPSMDMWYVERTEDGWSEPMHLGHPFNPGRSMFASTTLEGHLYTTFAERGPGASDIAVSRLENGVFSDLVHLGPEVNSPGQDAYPFVAPDESYLLFQSILPDGQPGIFVSFRTPDGKWTHRQAVDLGSHAAGLPWVSPDGKYLFFSADGDIYWVDSLVFKSLRPGELR
jgi:Tol biopolymer transport system component